MSLVAVRNAIARVLKSEIPSAAEVIEYGGPITVEELGRLATRSPSLIVSCLGLPSCSIEGSVVTAPTAFAVFVVSKDAVRGKRDIVAMDLAEKVVVASARQRWSSTASKPPKDLAATNLYTAKLDAAGLSMWVVRWAQQIDLEALTQAQLDDFLTFAAEYDIAQTDDTDPATTEDEFEVRA